MYFLRRGLFLPEELPALMGPDLARDGLARLAWPQLSQAQTDSVDDAAAVGLLESTLYLRNQLLRDSDWASMAHSLELRTPLVDSTLLQALAPYMSGFADGAGKAMIARSPRKPLPAAVVNRPKTGFSIPMAQWLSAAAQRRDWRRRSDAGQPRNAVGKTLGEDRTGPDAWMRVIHVVPAISEEASGPSYSVVRLCESLIDSRNRGPARSAGMGAARDRSVVPANLSARSGPAPSRLLTRDAPLAAAGSRQWLGRTSCTATVSG